MPQVKEGKLRALAVFGAEQLPTLPNVPTMTEAGYPDLLGENWFGVLVPAGTPKEIIALLHRQTVEMMRSPDMMERMATLGYGTVGNTPQEFGKQIALEIEKLGKVIRAANIKLQ